MFGMVGKMRVAPGRRSEMLAILSGSTKALPGCIHYIVSEDLGDPDGIWITEIWTSEESHKASLQLPEVKEAIARGRPLIAAFDIGARLKPVSGVRQLSPI